jgi:hypothetical protein
MTLLPRYKTGSHKHKTENIVAEVMGFVGSGTVEIIDQYNDTLKPTKLKKSG